VIPSAANSMTRFPALLAKVISYLHRSRERAPPLRESNFQ